MRYIVLFLGVIICFAAVNNSPAKGNTLQHDCTLDEVEGVKTAHENDLCLIAKINDLQKKLLRVETGEIRPTEYELGKFLDPTDSTSSTGCIPGDKAHRGIRSRFVKFEEPFKSAPSVVLGITSLAVVGALRIHAYPYEITENGFHARIVTYCDTKVHGINVIWTAHGY
ncbi:H-type lectin domain-containing protein [Roseibium sp.]|uniref:H-type lectin domain-containing protein n=1 Tax=Roseibium sp. TaxID=1936156 RepID=UPI003D12B489